MQLREFVMCINTFAANRQETSPQKAKMDEKLFVCEFPDTTLIPPYPTG